MTVDNDTKIKLTVDIFDFLHDKVFIALAKSTEQGFEVDHDEHALLMREVVGNLHEWLNKAK
jgi:hypothetical protein